VAPGYIFALGHVDWIECVTTEPYNTERLMGGCNHSKGTRGPLFGVEVNLEPMFNLTHDALWRRIGARRITKPSVIVFGCTNQPFLVFEK
jgi:hypothetical protein